MALVFAGIASHTPLLLPSVGKENLSLIAKTQQAMQQLEQDLYLAQPETIMIISPHGNGLPDALTINANPEYVTNFEEFGDLVTKLRWKSDFMLIDRIREDFKVKHLPLVLDSAESLDYGTSVPLFYLSQHLPQARIVPFIPSQHDIKMHFDIGHNLKDEIMSSTRRIAIIASADLSHRVGENSPDGFSSRGVNFDDKIVADLTNNNYAGILEIDDVWAGEAQSCGTKALAVLAGIMARVNQKTAILSYEKPLGVGYLVASSKIS